MSYQAASKSPDRKRCEKCGIWCDDPSRLHVICNDCIERAYAKHVAAASALRNLRRYQESIDRRIRKGGK